MSKGLLRLAVENAPAIIKGGKRAYDYYQEYQSKRPKKRARYSGSSRSMSTFGHGMSRFSRPKRVRSDPFKKNGSELSIESGDVIANAELARLGVYNSPHWEIMQSITRGLLRKLFDLYGITFSSYDDTPDLNFGLTLTLRYTYKEDPGSPLTSRSIALPIALNYYGLAQLFANEILDGSPAGVDGFILYDMYLVDTAATPNTLVRMDCVNAFIKLKCSTTFVVQNRTLGAAAADDQITDVTNNPVTGRMWMFTGNTCSAASNGLQTTISTADNASGLLVGGLDTDGPVGAFIKFQSPSAYRHCIGSSRVRIMPGGIKKSFVSSNYSMRLNTLFSKLSGFITKSTSAAKVNMRMPFGKSVWFEFEKVCDTRAGSQDISIGYEINTRISSYVSLSKPLANRIAKQI